MFNPYEYFPNKNVLLIGNGEVLNDIDYGKFNSIVRMNLGVQDKPCDVWINNLVTEGHNRLKEIPTIRNISQFLYLHRFWTVTFTFNILCYIS